MPYAIMYLDRTIQGYFAHYSEAYLAADRALARGHRRVAIIDAVTREIRTVLEPIPGAPGSERGGE